MQQISITGDDVEIDSANGLNDIKADEFLIGLGINPNPLNWSISVKTEIIKKALACEFKETITQARKFSRIIKEKGAIFSNDVSLETKLEFTEFIAWINGELTDEFGNRNFFSFLEVVSAEFEDNPEYIRMSPHACRDLLMETFASQGEKALDIYNKSKTFVPQINDAQLLMEF